MGKPKNHSSEERQEKNRRLVKELYEKYPYPSRGFSTQKEALNYVRWVSKIFCEDTVFWKGKKVLELGCGSGELACGLSVAGAKVTAIDLSSSSIKKAKELAKKIDAKSVEFINDDILEMKTELSKEYDIVIALGSLHHTIDAKKGFEIGCSKLKKGGLIIIGLYNKYSRARHRIKRIILRILAKDDIEKRIQIGEKLFGGNKSKSWLADKYGQVHESYHSINEIKKWFIDEKIDFISSNPSFKNPIIDEIKWLILKKNAFFVMVGRKRQD